MLVLLKLLSELLCIDRYCCSELDVLFLMSQKVLLSNVNCSVTLITL